jgi:pimeloyl-[acyl-carrier protein] synthase
MMTKQSVIFNCAPAQENSMAAPTSPAAPNLNPLQNPALLANPYSFYAMLRATNPVFRLPVPVETGAGIWLLTRHAEVDLAIRDKRFSVERQRADVVKLNPDSVPTALFSDSPGGLRTMLALDPPDHTRLRGLVSKAFTPRRIAALEPRIEGLVTELLDAALAAGGAFDLIRTLAEPLPAVVIAELLGVPAADHRQFKQWSSALIETLPQVPFGGAKLLDACVAPLVAYLADVITARRKDPQDDLISGMIEAQEERDALTDQELLSTCFLLLLAGHETTTNLIGNGTLALLRSPDQWARLLSEPALLPNAIEELLRYDSPVQGTVRVTLEPVKLGEHEVGAGALVICGIGAANRDPAVHPDPDRVDLGREDIRHLSFGIGAHFCLGAALARLEGRAVFAALAARCPELRLADPAAEPEHRPNFILRGLKALPVVA